MNRFTKFIATIDLAILVHGFVRPVWYIDWRWHKNQYDQAAVVLSAALGLDCAGIAALLLEHNSAFEWLVLVPITGVVIFMYGLYIKQLERAARDYERDSTRLYSSQRLFQVIHFPFVMRLFFLIQGLILGSARVQAVFHHPNAYEVIAAVSDYWMGLIGVGLYVAGVPHSRFQRKKKKERELSPTPLLQPSTFSTGR